MTAAHFHFQDRDMLDQFTPHLPYLKKGDTKLAYLGFDPSSDSLHLGNYQGIRALRMLQSLGWTPVVLIGGATGMIGDPSGKSCERLLLQKEQLDKNVNALTIQLTQLLAPEKGCPDPKFVNNATWLDHLRFTDFLRDIGRYFRVNTMLGKQSVRQRLKSSEGISYTEFTYQILQAYDFLHLHREMGVELQIGGSDQWGNITAGCDLIRKVLGKEVHGLTFPLLLRADGKKFGKSEQGAVWLSDQKLSPFDLYQYLLNIPDGDIPKILKRLTGVGHIEIENLKSGIHRPEGARLAQHFLAAELTRDIHGEKGLQSALRVTRALNIGTSKEIDKVPLFQARDDLPRKTFKRNQIIGLKIIELLFLSQLATSRAVGRRLILNGGIYLNGTRISDIHRAISQLDLQEGQLLELSVGRKRKLIVFLE